jgi:hypothetical protein
VTDRLVVDERDARDGAIARHRVDQVTPPPFTHVQYQAMEGMRFEIQL